MEKQTNKEKNDLAAQMSHEAEITRQHARYQIPAKMEIDGEIYKVKDWSMSGCSILNLPESYTKKFIKAKMIFEFDSFETSIANMNLEVLNKRGDFSGCRFTDMTPQQIAILNQIITAYLHGDIITQDDIITAVTKIQMYPKKKKIDEVEKKRAWGILSLIFITLFVLISFLGFIAYKKLFIINSINGLVDTNVTVLRAPYASVIKFDKKFKKNDIVHKNETVAIAYMINGSISRVISPIDGKILKIDTLNNEFRNTAEPILTIENNNAIHFIKAMIEAKNSYKLKVGYIVNIILNGEEIQGKITNITYPEDITSLNAKPVKNVYTNPRSFIQLTIIPLKNISSKWIGTSVTVKIDLFKNKFGLIHEK